jgi:transposase InsO family protein
MLTDQHQQVTELVHKVGRLLPRVGGKKLFIMIKPELKKRGIKMGRDLFFDHLRTRNLLIRPRRQYAVTTQSSHRFRIYDNLLLNKDLSQCNQAWVSDITYLRTDKGFCYLALVTDGWSRKIIGFDVSDSLELSGCLRALRCALKQLPANHQLIHHSDRGLQYCSNTYTDLLKENNIQISMAEKGNCYQNAIAERVNGILKNEFYLDKKFIDVSQARSATTDAILLDNSYRPSFKTKLSNPRFCTL